MERWLLTQDWETSIAAMPGGEKLPLFLVAIFAHVGVVIALGCDSPGVSLSDVGRC
ncbi:hypothetical protein [Streptomyces sp. Ac-502]|uniref:hypothetical protein n=1 Tax=Streptomyces sp. Ac-502 TaxID=3342801 RepID=UPI003862A74B